MDVSEQGQILPGSVFGDWLTQLAKQSEVIVEIGTWWGGGSTRCIANGLIRPSQKFYTFEVCREKWETAKARYHDPRIEFIHGSIIKADEMLPFEHPLNKEEYRGYYEADKKMIMEAPYVLDRVPTKIDLLLLDGGEWSSFAEFTKLAVRSKVIAMDDINPDLTVKNTRAVLGIMKGKYLFEKIIYDMEDRHGWLIARLI